MQIIRTAPINFLYFYEETTINELKRFLPVGQELIREAVRIGVPLTGPVHWHYYGFTGAPDQVFLLEVCLPIGEIPVDYDGKFHLKRTEAFECACALHSGSWYDLPATYQKMLEFIAAAGLKPIGQNREIYINVDFVDPDANETIVQMGIQQ